MLAIKAILSAGGPDRILRPARALRQLRPVSLGVASENLAEFGHLARALELHRRHGPLMLDAYDYPRQQLPYWVDVLRDFLQNVEAWGWFELDWGLLDDSFQSWMETGEGEYFAAYLYEIPIQLFGFSDWDESWPEQFPQVAMLRALVDETWGAEVLVSLVEEYDISTDFAEVTHWQIQDRLDHHDFGPYGEPLCWLPELARIACGRSGNPVLDGCHYFEEEPLGWTWDDDLETAKAAWAEAKPSIDHWRTFIQWCDNSEQMQELVDVLCGEPPRAAYDDETEVLDDET